VLPCPTTVFSTEVVPEDEGRPVGRLNPLHPDANSAVTAISTLHRRTDNAFLMRVMFMSHFS
jgi:hypothetical protein